MSLGDVPSRSSESRTAGQARGGESAALQADRRAEYWPIAEAALRRLYGERPGFGAWLEEVEQLVARAAEARPEDLRALDREREQGPAWTAPNVVGYSAYVDRFAGSIAGLSDKLDYLSELGVTYLHLLPLSKPRQGDSDGGYAVADFEAVNPALGTIEDLTLFARDARRAGISLVVDLVCNHTADDHRWALAARRDDPRYRDYYHFVSEAEAAALEKDLIEVFPETAPGNFTYVAERGAWVWTTFYPFQWDLNYANPAVFAEMLSVLLNLSNLGVEGFRLDSAPFLWKRPGTNSRNQPEVHDVLAAWRALLSIAAPGVVLKAEAIERLEQVLPYFGGGGRAPECDLAYNNGVMAGLWASLVSQEAEATHSLMLASQAKPKQAIWVNYLRCHDDIIFSALSPYISAERQAAAARALTKDGGGFSRGEIFQVFDGVPSINGMAASLTGANDDPDSSGVDRLLLLYGVLFALQGIPVLYMGDEIALLNDEAYIDDPARAAEGRWLQRPRMDWSRAERRNDPGGVAGRVFQTLRRFIAIRGEEAGMASTGAVGLPPIENPAVLCFTRGQGEGEIFIAANFSDAEQSVAPPFSAGLPWRDLLSDESGQGPRLVLAPYQVRWVKRAS